MAGETLVDFGGSFDAARVTPLAGARFSLVQAGVGRSLRVTAGPSAESPGIELTAPVGGWDLSAYTHAVVEVKNVGRAEVSPHCRLENPGAQDGKLHCVFDIATALPGGSSLLPGQSGTLLVELCRKKPAWVRVDLCGMIGRPWSDSPADSRPERAIDPAGVVKLVVYVSRPSAEVDFEIVAVRGAGKHIPPTQLLGDPKGFFPFIDEMGQYIHADWPGKAHTLDEMASQRRQEERDLAAHPGPAGFDRFGGWRDGPALEATGWFRTARHEGKWWLVDPEGRLFFSHGIDCVNWREGNTPVEEREHYFRGLPPRDGEYADCYGRAGKTLMGHYKDRAPMCFAFGQANLRRKYGRDWQGAYADVSHRRLRSWGLNTIGNWSEPAIYGLSRTPYTVNVRFGGKLLEGSQGYWGKFRDVFDDDFVAQVRAALAEQTSLSAKDPWCLGYFVDNEIAWGTDDVSLAAAALASPADQAAKRVFLADLRAKYAAIGKLNAAWGTTHASWEALLACRQPPDANKAHDDLAAFHAKTAEMYFRTVRQEMKKVVPHQLYLGCRFAWYNGPAVAASARHCDVVSFNIYQRTVANFHMPEAADVPLMIGEFHFGALDRGMFHTGLCPMEDQARRAEAYREYVRGMLRHRQFVGGHWFKYMDEPTTGRPLDEENYQVGFVSIADSPYEETLEAAREIGATMYPYRLAGK